MRTDTDLLERLYGSAVWQLVGNTPLIEFRSLSRAIGTRIYGKCEGFNPGGSVKDRAACLALEEAIRTGQVRANTTVLESSSGNMGIALAQVCAVLGLRFVCVVDPKISKINRELLESYGAGVAEVQVPDPRTGEYLPARLALVRRLREQIPDSYWPDQYTNRASARVQASRTLPEILACLPRHPDFLLVAVSTGGTILGCEEFVRRQRLPTQVVAVDGLGSSIYPNAVAGARQLPGLGAAVRTALASASAPDMIVRVSDDQCRAGCRRLRDTEGLLVGASAGGLVSAIDSLVAAGRIGADDICVALISDRGDRYGQMLFACETPADVTGLARPPSNTMEAGT